MANILSNLFGRRAPEAEPANDPPTSAMTTPAPTPDPAAGAVATRTPEQLLTEAFWILLGRGPSDVELRDQAREAGGLTDEALARRLMSSTEFGLVYTGWKQGMGSGRDPRAREAGLAALSGNADFARRAYYWVLGREADEGGLAAFVAALEDGASRSHMVRGLVMSDEFAQRYGVVAPQVGFVPRDTQLCELSNPAKWDNPDWMALLHDQKVLADHKLAMHRKTYEFTQLLYGLERLGHLTETTSVLSVGAGHEAVLYWLANHVGKVVATDLYEGVWQSVGAQEGDARVVESPEQYAPYPYRTDRLVFMKMNGLDLQFPENSFDVAYSLSSIEHFGGLSGAAAALDEMARVLKPGGIAAIATEFALAGPAHEEVFQPDEIRQLFDRPHLRLVEPIDDRVYQRYQYEAVDLYANAHQTPHMVVRMGDTVFTSVFAFLRKV